jgi:uncharacterized protein YjiS (DUF1127 family)
MVRYAPSRRAPERATTDHIAPLAMIRRILAVMRLPRGRVRSRQQLKELDNHPLMDIGLGREAIDYTSPRPELHWHWDWAPVRTISWAFEIYRHADELRPSQCEH